MTTCAQHGGQSRLNVSEVRTGLNCLTSWYRGKTQAQAQEDSSDSSCLVIICEELEEPEESEEESVRMTS